MSVVRWLACNRRPIGVAITLALMVLGAELVMVHGYRFGLQWGPDRHVELAPAHPATGAP